MSHHHLLSAENRLSTRAGKAFLTERVVMHGKDLHQELGDFEWMRLYLYSILGRDPGEPMTRMLNYFWVATSYPDSSIWPNHVVSLAASARTTPSLGLMAGMSISEASIYGRRPEVRALDFFYRAGRWCDEGGGLFEFVEQEKAAGRTLYGYGRPLARNDERIPYTLKKAEEFGLESGRYLQMAKDIYHYLNDKYGYSVNIAAINTAIVADMGLTCEQYQLFLTPCFVTGMAPCFVDTKSRPEGAYFPMRCESLKYSGVAPRAWD